jgi:hypothetical protein
MHSENVVCVTEETIENFNELTFQLKSPEIQFHRATTFNWKVLILLGKNKKCF